MTSESGNRLKHENSNPIQQALIELARKRVPDATFEACDALDVANAGRSVAGERR